MAISAPIIYFHGIPGGPGELNALCNGALRLTKEDYVPNRQKMNKGVGLCKHFDMLASDIKTRFDKSPVRFVGFSVGAYVALEVASRMGPAVDHISLVSAAAPLETGHFLPEMAGKVVFQSARYAPLLFAALTSVQTLVLRVAPDRLFDALFASAQGMDRDLAVQPHFRGMIIETLKECLQDDNTNYRRELNGYVRDWSAILPLISQPVELWHGSLDNWAPPSMADALAKALPNVRALHKLAGGSHYSTLQTFFERPIGHVRGS
jgi:pimeloyl-ACP methyl ester carboxylesterase